MKKDKDWLSEQVGDLNSTDAVFNEIGVSYIDTAVSIERVFDLIYQLDEPDADQAYKDGYDTGRMHASKPDKLLIPKFVADWWGTSDYVCLYGGMRCRKEAKFDLISLFHDRGLEDYLWKVEDWIENNKDDFIDLVNGKSYKVEEEPKYYVMDDETYFLLKIKDKVRRFENFTNYSNIKHTFQLTEQEIKDFDERFWPFAVPVEELTK